MKRQILFSAACLLLTTFSAFGALTNSGKLLDAQIVQGELAASGKIKVFVNVKTPTQMAKVDWQSPESVKQARYQIAANQASVLFLTNTCEVKLRHRYENAAGFSCEVNESGLQQLLNNPNVVSIQPVRKLQLMLAQGIPLINGMTVRNTYNGKGVSIAICDSGVDYRHPRLGAGGFPNKKVIGGYDCNALDNDPKPDANEAHGTCCAGIAAGDLGTVGDYIGGVAHNAKIYALKINYGDTGAINEDAALKAWDWCLTHRNDNPEYPLVAISNSWGGGKHFSAREGDAENILFTQTAKNLVNAGITILAAAGNNGFTNALSHPASMSDVISVGALDDVRSTVMWYSNSANFLDVFAPADPTYAPDIIGANGYNTDPNNGDYYDRMNGTSAATPYVAGAVAVLQSAAKSKMGRFLTPYEVKDYLITNGDLVTDTKANITKPRINLGNMINNIADVQPPQPAVAEWSKNGDVVIGKPKAVGRFTIVMQVQTLEDPSGVEYYFECVEAINSSGVITHPNINSGWQTSTIYQAKSLSPNTTYTFRVKGRDRSTQFNETKWSTSASAKTANLTDDKSPWPDPAQWEKTPRYFQGTSPNMEIVMQAKTSYDEPNVKIKYEFICLQDSRYSRLFSDASAENSTYNVKNLGPGTYTFTVQAEDTIKNNKTAISVPMTVILTAPGKTLKVPMDYPTIQDAIDHAVDGDEVVISPGTYRDYLYYRAEPEYTYDVNWVLIPNGRWVVGTGRNVNMNFYGKKITVRSENPDDPAVVASTIIDCYANGNTSWYYEDPNDDQFDHTHARYPRRAFLFEHGEGSDSVLAGLTIINGYFKGGDGRDTLFHVFRVPTTSDPNGQDGYPGTGGAIACYYDPVTGRGSSPTIKNCIIRDCIAQGGNGEKSANGVNYNRIDGRDGTNTRAVEYGKFAGDGGDSGSGFGGAIFCDANSNAVITDCTIENCQVLAGVPGPAQRAGNGGNGDGGEYGGDGAHGGRGGDANQVAGGGIYFGDRNNPFVKNVKVLNCLAQAGTGGDGGNGGNGGKAGGGNGDIDGGEPNDGGRGGIAYGADGGGIYYGHDSSVTLIDSEISNNQIIAGEAGNGGNGGNAGAPHNDGIKYWGGNGGDAGSQLQGNGGGIFIGQNSISSILNTLVSANQAIAFGVDSILNGSSLKFGRGGTGRGRGYDGYRGNWSWSFGGGIYYDPNCIINLVKTKIQSNSAYAHGGGIYSAGASGDAIVTDCEISGNFAGNGNPWGRGGGFYWYDTQGNKLTFKECSIYNNMAQNTPTIQIGEFGGGAGGGIYSSKTSYINFTPQMAVDYNYLEYTWLGWRDETPQYNNVLGTSVILDHTELYGNTAGFGAGAAIHEAHLDVVDSNILGNVSEYGGGLFCARSDLTTQRSMINENMAIDAGNLTTYGSGAGLFCLDSSASLINTVLLNNQSEGSGGGAFFSGPYLQSEVSGARHNQEFINCLVAGNIANIDGGGLSANFNAVIDVNNSTFADNNLINLNFGSGGGLSCYDASVFIDNSIFWNNTAKNGSQISLGDPLESSSLVNSNLWMTSSDIQGGTESIYQAPGDGPMLIVQFPETIKNIDPLFVFTSSIDLSRNYYLSHKSAGQVIDSNCINGGDMPASKLAFQVGSNITTSTNHSADTGKVDLGFHYIADSSPVIYELTLQALEDTFYGGVHGTVFADVNQDDLNDISDPIKSPLTDNKFNVLGGVQVNLYADAEPGYSIRWTGTDNDSLRTANNTVTMGSDKVVQVVFYRSRVIPVSGGGGALQDAVYNAVNGDIIVVAPGIYDGDIDFGGKAITIVSSNPDDPSVIARTIIDCRNASRAFTFSTGENENSVLDGFTIINAFSFEDGGAIYIGNGCSPTLQNLYISDCYTAGDGGAIFIASGSESKILNVNIGNCGAGSGQGGGVFIADNSMPVFRYCTFSNCYSYGSGGGVYAGANTDLTFFECKFSDNEADLQGGGFFLGSNSLVDLTNCIFEYNYSATSDGGAVYFSLAARTNLKGCQFNSNGYALSGGAVYCEMDVQSNITDCNFVGNGAWKDGGAVYYSVSNSISIEDCNFSDNIVFHDDYYSISAQYYGGSGGALYCDSNSVGSIASSKFLSNAANENGGALSMSKANISITDCNITFNNAKCGGGVYALHSDQSELINNSLSFNQAAGYTFTRDWVDVNGVPLPVTDANGHWVKSSTQPAVCQGGAIYSFDGPALIANCQIRNNSSITSGGGIYFGGQQGQKTVDLINCLITSNSAMRDGGGVSTNWENQLKVTNCTFSQNLAAQFGGALYSSYGSDVQMIDSISWENNSLLGSELYVGLGFNPDDTRKASIKVTYSDIDTRPLPPKQVFVESGAIRPMFDANDANDAWDVYLPFYLNYFGNYQYHLYINENGNVTFNDFYPNFNKYALTTNIGVPMIAPFFGDALTTPFSIYYGPGFVDGREAFGVTWENITYASGYSDKFNTFQLIFIDRSDRNFGDFDMEFNYDQIQWETGGLNGGRFGLGGDSARVGFSAGTGLPGTFFELLGSGIPGYFLDSNLDTGLIHNGFGTNIAGRYLFSVVNGVPNKPSIDGPAVYVEPGCDPISDYNEGGWDINDWPQLTSTDPNFSWSPQSHNFCEDPMFRSINIWRLDYYLSQYPAGQILDTKGNIVSSNQQDANSPCIKDNAGSRDATVFFNEIDSLTGLTNSLTTRTDYVTDYGTVNLGYHYNALLPVDKYELKLDLLGDQYSKHGKVQIDVIYKSNKTTYSVTNTKSITVNQGSIVKLTAQPDDGYRVRMWAGADGEPFLTETDPNVNVVTMTSARYVKTYFESDVTNNYFILPGGRPTVYEAISAARDGDNIIFMPGTHVLTETYGIDPMGKKLLFTSIRPYDQATVDRTVIDCRGTSYDPRRAFWFHSGETKDTILDGLTIINGYAVGDVGASYAIPGYPPYFPNKLEFVTANGGEDANGVGVGGAILCELGSSPTIRNCVIRNSAAIGAQGGDGAPGRSPYSDTEPDGQWGGDAGNAWGTGYGGAIACLSKSNPLIENCLIKDNIASGAFGGQGGKGGNGKRGSGKESWGGDSGYAYGDGLGGAIYFDANSAPTITKCDFINNTATHGVAHPGGLRGTGGKLDPRAQNGYSGYIWGLGGTAGGAIKWSGASNAVITDCTFIENKAYGQGVYSEDYIDYYIESGISPYDRGGAIYGDPNSKIDFDDCNFIGNYGSAVYADVNSILSFEKCYFEDNQIATFGGAINTASGNAGSLRINDNIFRNNTAFGGGGAIYLRADADINDCTFAENKSEQHGGAIYADCDDPNARAILEIKLKDCSFTQNRSRMDYTVGTASSGGALYFIDCNSTINNCYFVRNTAKSGGAMFLYGGKLHANGGLLTENRASGNDGPEMGGAIACMDTAATIENCIMLKNFATSKAGSGGAINITGGNLNHTIKNCLFDNNMASLGGAISCNVGVKPVIQSCTFSENTDKKGGGAIYYDQSSSASLVVDCIFESCSPYAIFEERSSDRNIHHCLFYEEMHGQSLEHYFYFDAATGPHDIENIKTANIKGCPNFVSGPFGDKYLRQYSNSALDSGSTDTSYLQSGKFTTNPAGTRDTGDLDRGFHYLNHNDPSYPKFNLKVRVVGGHGSVIIGEVNNEIHPAVAGTNKYFANVPIKITAIPDIGYRVNSWAGGTINDETTETSNMVILTRDTEITVSFEQPATLYTTEYSSIQETLDAAKNGDIVVINKPINYIHGIVIEGKEFTLIGGTDPTILDGGGVPGHWISWGMSLVEVGPKMIIKNITIQNFNGHAGNAIRPDGETEGPDGGSAAGMGINLANASPTFINCTITNNSLRGGNGAPGAAGNQEGEDGGNGGWGGVAYGAGVYCAANSNPRFENCKITNNTAIGGNGGNGGKGGRYAWGGRGGSYSGTNTDFYASAYPMVPNWEGWLYGPYEDYRRYSAYGGGLFADKTSSPVLINCEISGNVARGGYSGVSGTNYGGTISEPATRYHIDAYGAGVCFAYEVPNADIYTPYIYDVFDVNCSPKLINCQLRNNLADPNNSKFDSTISYGGAASCDANSSPWFEDCDFYGNISGFGGALHTNGATAYVVDSNFGNNTAARGGAACIDGGNTSMIGCTFTDNRTEGYIDPNRILDPNAIQAAKDIEGQGGAIYLKKTVTTLEDSQFTDNYAARQGGAIFMTGSDQDPGHTLVRNCLFDKNSAIEQGAAVGMEEFAQAEFVNCTVYNNRISDPNSSGYGGGLCVAYDSNAIITNSIFWENFAPNGTQISVGPGAAVVSVDHSDIQGAGGGAYVASPALGGNIWLDQGSLLNWRNNNKVGLVTDDPLFVSFLTGDFYLSKLGLQAANSPAIDFGSGEAKDLALGRYRYTTSIDNSYDVGPIDIGYHYYKYGEFTPGDINYDAGIDIRDVQILLSYWLDDTCQFPGYCEGADLNRDGIVNYKDYAVIMKNYLQGDIQAPKPNPSTWAIPPRSTGAGSIEMAATPSYDNSGYPVEYYFDCVVGNGPDRGWDPCSTFQVNNLPVGKEFAYKVRARDIRGKNDPSRIPNDGTGEYGNKTEWSSVGYVIVGDSGPDMSSPLPNPLTWAPFYEPFGSSPTTITMRCVTAIDNGNPANLVQYNFMCIAGDGNDSGWQDSTEYIDVTLNPLETATYVVIARDKFGNQTQPSIAVTATTLAPGMPPIFDDGQPPSTPFILPPPASYGFFIPAGDGFNNLIYHVVVSSVSIDLGNSPVEYKFICWDDPSISSDWLPLMVPINQYTVQVMEGLGQSYGRFWKVKARDRFGRESETSPPVVVK